MLCGSIDDKEVNRYIFGGVAVTLCITEQDIPIFSCIVTDEGEICGAWIDPEFRKRKDVHDMIVKAVAEASCGKKELFARVHSNNVRSFISCMKHGATIDIDTENPDWVTVSWTTSDLLLSHY